MCFEFVKKVCKMSDTKYPVKLITTNTRLGFVDVKALCDTQPPGTCDREDEPDNIYHGALVAYGFVYEYIFDSGIDVTEEKKYFADSTPIWIDDIFETEKTQKEFEAWIETKKNVEFSQKSYHVSDNNCLHFTHAATEYLGGKEPAKQSGQREWLFRNRKIAIVIQELLEAQRDPPKDNEVESTNPKPE